MSVCYACHNVIQDRFILLVGDKKLHNRCLNCSRCRISLSMDKTCYDKRGDLYCDACYFRLFAVVRCMGCLQGIAKSEYVMKTNTSYYHVYCFRCQHCKMLLKRGQRYGVRDQDLYCEEHYYQKNFCNTMQNTAHVFEGNHLGAEDQVPILDVENYPFGRIKEYNEMMTNIPAYMPSLERSNTEIMHHLVNDGGKPFPSIFSIQPDKHIVNDSCYYPPSLESEPSHSISPTTSLSDEDRTSVRGKGKKMYRKNSHKEKRYRTTFTPEQINFMKEAFEVEKNPDSAALGELSEKINLSKRVLQVWFQNSRAKYKKSNALSDLEEQMETRSECASQSNVNGDSNMELYNEQDIE